ncbi:Uncharacterized protein Rs2_39234 [Raphanus sativus]|nr:Uncharacterized protein Rs2_39234 [Raphanus sativus]
MEWDEIKANCREQGFDLDEADDLPELTEEEMAVMNLEIEENAILAESEELLGNVEEIGQQTEEETKAQVTKKRLFKSTMTTAASNKMRSAKALASPRKRIGTTRRVR